MASYADELLADLGDSSGDELQLDGQDQNGAAGEQADTNGNGHASSSKRKHDDDSDDDMDGDDNEGRGDDEDDEDDKGRTAFNDELLQNKNAVKPSDEMEQDDVDKMDMAAVESVKSISKLLDLPRTREMLKNIDHYASLKEPDIAGVLEESPEYQLIVRSNNLAVEIDNEIMVVHKFIRDHFSPRFPELETLILNPWEFVRAVQAIGNTDDLSKAKLEGVLPHGTVVVISMTASTTNGRPLPASEWRKVEEACDVVVKLEDARRKILEYVESRMTLIAPNLSAVVGTRVATKLLGVAGGLNGLAKIPASNLALLGASRKAATGFSSAHSGRRQGFIFQTQLVQEVGEDYQRQAQRIVSAKALLAARVDAGSSDRHGTYGAKLRKEIEAKLDKIQEPPPVKMTKALPVPKEGTGNKKRRGGRRARKLKEKYGMTELRKMQNRVGFNQPEEEAGAFDETVGLGMINSGSGKVRAQKAQGLKLQISKSNKNRLAALRGASQGGARALDAAGGESSGTASSLSFTPVQGIELVNPSAQKKRVEDANAKWFKEGMFSLAPGAQGSSSSLLPGSNLSAPSNKPKTTSSQQGSMAPPALPGAKK